MPRGNRGRVVSWAGEVGGGWGFLVLQGNIADAFVATLLLLLLLLPIFQFYTPIHVIDETGMTLVPGAACAVVFFFSIFFKWFFFPVFFGGCSGGGDL